MNPSRTGTLTLPSPCIEEPEVNPDCTDTQPCNGHVKQEHVHMTHAQHRPRLS